MRILYALVFVTILTGCKTEKEEPALAENETAVENEFVVQQEEKFEITPISHATMVLNWDDTIIYVDPVGGSEAFKDHPSPDLILVTDIHGDHLNVETIEGVSTDNTSLIAPKAVIDKLPANFTTPVILLNNGETKELNGFTVEAIPMYNLREEALKFHTKGRGNGYVIEKNGKRVYISGDTEDIPEMRALKDIDVAFVCMNLPYTMTELSAAKAVVDFKPKKVYPYHYRGSEGFSDVNKFKGWIMKSSVAKEIEVVQLDWYPNKE